MSRPRSPNRDKAKKLWIESNKTRRLKDIAEELEVSEEQVRKWKNQDKWNKVTLPNTISNVTKHKGGQSGNKNAGGNDGGAPEQNKNAEKHGFFSRYLPEETFSIIQEIEQKNPLDILWENIQIAYAAIVRAQQIMHVTEKEEMIKELKKSKVKNTDRSTKQTTSNSSEEEFEYEFQFAWDRQATFLKAQSRAQGELRSLIKQYDDMLHKNWELATEEQRARIDVLKSQVKTDTSEQVQDWKEAIIEIAKRRGEKKNG